MIPKPTTRREIFITVLMLAGVAYFFRVLCRCVYAMASSAWDAVDAEDVSTLREYAKEGGDLEMGTLILGETLLLRALRKGKVKSYSCLLDLGASPNTVCRGGGQVIHEAATKKDPLWLKLALEHGGDPNTRITVPFRRASPAIFAAIQCHRYENAVALLEHGADPNAEDAFQGRVLPEAASNMEFRLVEQLLNRGIDWQTHSMNGNTLALNIEARMPVFYGPNAQVEFEAYCRVRTSLKDKGVNPTSELLSLERAIVRPDLDNYGSCKD